MKIDVDSFSYLGVHLFYNRKFTRTQNVLASQGRKSMFHTMKICNENALNTETKLEILVFDTYVSSVLNYCCEVWGFSAAKDIEKVHLEFCKRIMHIKKSTPSFIVFSKLGRLPLNSVRKERILKYWVKLLETDNCILKFLYNHMLDDIDVHYNWLTDVRNLIQNLGLGYVWKNQLFRKTNHHFLLIVINC
jgi:hypothetical protein